MTGPKFPHIHSRTTSEPARNRGVVLSVLFFSVLFITAASTAIPPSSGFCDQLTTYASESLQTESFRQAMYLTTRREAVVTYVKALQAPEGYFHGWLQAPPPFEPDGTSADYTIVMDAYDTLRYVERVSSVDWTKTKQFLVTLVDADTGLLNFSKNAGVSGITCWAAVSFCPELGLGYLIDKSANADYMAGLQQPDGGFLFCEMDSKTTLVATYFALDSLRLLDELHLVDTEKAKEFLSSCHNEGEGWYSDTAGGPDNIFVTAAGIMIADMLGVLDDASRDKTAEYLLENWNLATGSDITEDLYITDRIAWSLALLDRKELIDGAKMAQWVLNLQKHMNGAFVGYPEADLEQERLTCVKYAMHILCLYNETYRLDEAFSVVEEPVWEIPQWWLDYISSEWGTTTTSRQGSGFAIYLPDLSIVIANLPMVALIGVLAMPAVWVANKRRMEKARRRELKRGRESQRRNA